MIERVAGVAAAPLIIAKFFVQVLTWAPSSLMGVLCGGRAPPSEFFKSFLWARFQPAVSTAGNGVEVIIRFSSQQVLRATGVGQFCASSGAVENLSAAKISFLAASSMGRDATV